MTNITNVGVLLAKLDKLTYIGIKKDVLKTKEGFEISYSTKLHHTKSAGKFPSIQIVLNIRFNGQHVQHWGCIDEDDTRAVVDWFLIKDRDASDFEYDLESLHKKAGQTAFNKL